MAEEKQIFDVDGVSKYLHASHSTVYKLAQTGAIPCQKFGRQWRFSQDQIDRWLENNEVGAALANVQTGVPSQARAAGSSGPGMPAPASSNELVPFFTPEQMTTLRTFGVDTVSRLALRAATSTGRKGLCALLEITSEELEEILQKIVTAPR